MASRFWVGGAGTWDASDTTHWAATTGAAGGQSVPIAGDTATFDASSGGGTVTVNHATLNVANLTISLFTGTLDFATNDNNITITGLFTNNGSGTRTLNMGDGTWTMSQTTANIWIQNGATNLTFNCNGSTLSFTGTSSTAIKVVSLGAFTYNIVTFAASPAGYSMTGASIIATWNISAPTTIGFGSGTTYRTTNALTLTGSSGNVIGFQSGTFGTSFTLQLDAASTGTWCSMRDMTNTTSSFTLTNSFDLGRNTFTGGGSITAPSGGGSSGGQRVYSG